MALAGLLLAAEVADRLLPALAAGSLLALALFTRPTFCLALPLVFPLAWRLSARNRWLLLGATGLWSALFVAFVWQTTSAGKGPQHLLARAEAAVGWGGALAAGLVALTLALLPLRRGGAQVPSALLLRAGWVTATPLLLGALVLLPTAPRKSLGSAPLWIYGAVLRGSESTRERS